MVSNEFWAEHLGGDRRLENLHVTLRGGSYDVVGVMPPGFAYPSRAQVWIGSFYKDAEQFRTAFLWSGVGRLRSGVTLEAARADIDAVMKRVVATYGKPEAGAAGARVRLLQEDIVGDRRTPSCVFFMLFPRNLY